MKTLDDALLRVVSNFENVHDLSKQHSAAITFFHLGPDFAHRARKISSLATCDFAHKSVTKALRTLDFSALPADVVSAVTTNCADIRCCEVFG